MRVFLLRLRLLAHIVPIPRRWPQIEQGLRAGQRASGKSIACRADPSVADGVAVRLAARWPAVCELADPHMQDSAAFPRAA